MMWHFEKKTRVFLRLILKSIRHNPLRCLKIFSLTKEVSKVCAKKYPFTLTAQLASCSLTIVLKIDA